MNISALLFDELHAQRNYSLWNTLRYGGAARSQPVLLWITTAGFDRTSLCWEMWQRAKGIQEGRIVDTTFLPCIYEPATDADWHDPAVWQAVNPSYGITMGADDFAVEHDEACSLPSAEGIFKRYRLNIWTQQATRWIPGEQWDACGESYTLADMAGVDCKVGIDLATTTDLAALSVLFRLPNGHYRALWYFWASELAAKRREQENRMRLDWWAEQGHVTICKGPVIDFGLIRAKVNELRAGRRITTVAMDPWNAAQLATDLASDGFAVEFVRQGFSMFAATKEFEKRVMERTLHHDGNPVMRWMVGNCAVKQDDNGNIKPSKVDSAEKIDGVIAVLLPLAIEVKELSSVYTSGGLTVL